MKQRFEVQLEQTLAEECFGDIASSDASRNAYGHHVAYGLRISDDDGIVLMIAGEYLNGAICFVTSLSNGIEFSLFCGGSQVGGIFRQGGGAWRGEDLLNALGPCALGNHDAGDERHG